MKIEFPVILDTPDINFVIVGPYGEKDGILVKSNDNDFELLGAAHVIYNGFSPDESNFVKLTGSQACMFFWSNNLSLSLNNKSEKYRYNFENRNFKVLLCCRVNNTLIKRNKYQHYDTLRELFIKVSYNAIEEVFNDNISSKERKYRVLWNLSPILSSLKQEQEKFKSGNI